MTVLFKYHFHIVDNEYDTEYNFEAYFRNHFEAATFIEENEQVGNVITVLAPFFEQVQLTRREVEHLWG